MLNVDETLKKLRNVVPKIVGFKAMLAHALSTPYPNRVRTPKDGEVIPGIKTGPKCCALRRRVLGLIHDTLGEEKALKASYVLCETGHPANPMGIPSTLDNVPYTKVTGDCLASIRALAAKLWTKATLRPSSLSLPRQSTTGFEKFQAGPEGLAIKLAAVCSFIKYKDWIGEKLEQDDWISLMGAGPGDDYYPLNTMASNNYRIQPQAAKSITVRNGVVESSESKERETQSADGTVRKMDFHLEYDPVCFKMRPRVINQVNAPSNVPAQGNTQQERGPMYDNDLWHCPSIPDRIARARAEYSDAIAAGQFVVATWDFSHMEKSMDENTEFAYYDGLNDAGISRAYVNLVKALHFGPFLATDDDYLRKQRIPTKIIGDPYLRQLLDLGTRSGEHDTDVKNKTKATGIYDTGLLRTGAYGEGWVNAGYAEHLEHHWKWLAGAHRAPSAMFTIYGDTADDCVMAGWKPYLERLMRWYDQCGPKYVISVESESQYLGEEIWPEGKAVYPFISKFPANLLSPERFWYDPIRRDGAALGFFQQIEHYKRHPEFEAYYWAINKACTEIYGFTPEEAVRAEVSSTPEYHFENLADVLLARDPSVITWGRVSYNDLSQAGRDLYEKYYLTIEPEDVARLCIL